MAGSVTNFETAGADTYTSDLSEVQIIEIWSGGGAGGVLNGGGGSGYDIFCLYFFAGQPHSLVVGAGGDPAFAAGNGIGSNFKDNGNADLLITTSEGKGDGTGGVSTTASTGGTGSSGLLATFAGGGGGAAGYPGTGQDATDDAGGGTTGGSHGGGRGGNGDLTAGEAGSQAGGGGGGGATPGDGGAGRIRVSSLLLDAITDDNPPYGTIVVVDTPNNGGVLIDFGNGNEMAIPNEGSWSLTGTSATIDNLDTIDGQLILHLTGAIQFGETPTLVYDPTASGPNLSVNGSGIGSVSTTTTVENTVLQPLTAGVISAVSHTTTTITNSWTDGSSGFDVVIAQMQQSAHGADTWTDVLGATSSPGVDTGLTPGVVYDYRVKYDDGVSPSVYSNTISITTSGGVTTPSSTRRTSSSRNRGRYT